MKRTGTCPKCGSRDVVKASGDTMSHSYIVVSVFGTAPIDRWVCCACGFAEEWVPEEYLDKARDWWSSKENME